MDVIRRTTHSPMTISDALHKNMFSKFLSLLTVLTACYPSNPFLSFSLKNLFKVPWSLWISKSIFAKRTLWGKGWFIGKFIVNGTANMTLALLSRELPSLFTSARLTISELSARGQLKGRIRRPWMRGWKTSCPLILSFLRPLAFQGKQGIVEPCSPP